MKKSIKNQKDEYYVDFKGVRLNKLEANRIGVGIIFGIFGIILLFFLPIEPKSLSSYILLVLCVFIGYFLVSPIIFKNNK